MRIGWVIFELSAAVASTRYRAYYPAIALQKLGVESRFYRRSSAALAEISELDAVVLVKLIDDDGPKLASCAQAMGKRVIIDLCDNVVVWSYEKTPSRRAALNLAAASVFADAIVTPSPALANAVQRVVATKSRFVIIPDMVETRSSVTAARALAQNVRRPVAPARHQQVIWAFVKHAVFPARQAAQVVGRKLSSGVSSGPHSNAGRLTALAAATPRRRSATERVRAFARLAVLSPHEAKQVGLRKLALLMPLRFPDLRSALVVSTPMPARPTPRVKATLTSRVNTEAVVSASRDCTQKRTVVWFGNWGAPHSDFGLLALLPTIPALQAVARDIPLELVVITNSRPLYDAYIAAAGVPSRYVEWSPERVFRALETADVCLLPFGRDAFSLTKSANRAVLALAHGVPVVASGLASFEPLVGAVVLDDWEGGLRRYVGPEAATARRDAIAAAKPILESLYSAEATGRAWCELLNAPRKQVRLGSTNGAGDVLVGVLLNLVQDLDLLLPVIDELRRRADVRLKLIVAPKLVDDSPRVLRAIIERSIVPYAIDGPTTLLGDDRVIRGLDALLTASETSLNPHRYAHALTKAANGLGIATYTLQHGLENVGLSYFDKHHSTDVSIEADHVLTWTDPAQLPAETPAETRAKCRAVGRTTRVENIRMVAPPELAGRRIVGVFENLHWHRYSEAYRRAFMADLIGFARARPQLTVLLKPHHAGLYLVKNPTLLAGAPSNFIIADPEHKQWEPFTAPALIPLCKAIITTPSTVALDAAELDVPIAVARYDLDLPVFSGLRQLASVADWLAFVDAAFGDPATALSEVTAFRDRVRLPGDAAKRVVNLVLSECGQDRQCPRSTDQATAALW